MNYDFTLYEINKFKLYGGANGSKICIKIFNEDYMLKLPPIAKYNQNISYSNSCVSEYISCKIIESLGLSVQETILGMYGNKIAVACKDFTGDGFVFKDFAHLKNTIITSSENGYGTELSSILETIKEQNLIDEKKILEFFWDMFVVDSLIGNFDRHNGNWGFLINEEKREVRLAPIFDCGSSLFPQIDEQGMIDVLTNEKELEKRTYVYPNSAIKENNVKINYFDFLSNTKNEDCLKSLKEISNKVDLGNIEKIIEDTPYIDNLQKNFFRKIIKTRYDKILVRSLEIQKKRYPAFFEKQDDLKI